MRHKIPAFISRRNAYERAFERVRIAPPIMLAPIDPPPAAVQISTATTSDTAPGPAPVQIPVATSSSTIPDESLPPQIQTRSSRRLAAKASCTAGPSKRDRDAAEDESRDEPKPRVRKQKGENTEPSASAKKRDRDDDEDESQDVPEPPAKKRRNETKEERSERLAVERAAKELAVLKARQEALRQAFDPVARALQPALKELAARSQRELKLDAKTAAEVMIEEQLDVEMQENLTKELKEYELRKKQELRLGIEEVNHINHMAEVRVKDIKEEYITHVKVDFMKTIRHAELGADDPDSDLGLGPNTRHRYHGETCTRPPDTEFFTQANKVWDDWVSRLDRQDARLKATRHRRSTRRPLELPEPLAYKKPSTDAEGLDLLVRATAFVEEDTSNLDVLAEVALYEDPNMLLSHIPAKCRMPPPPPSSSRRRGQ